MKIKIQLIVVALVLPMALVLACAGTGQNIPEPSLVVAATSTFAPIIPTFTLAPATQSYADVRTPSAIRNETVVPQPTVAATRQVAAPIAVRQVASDEAAGQFAVALLTAVPLTPGHSYQLVISSPSGKAAFHGEWSASAVGADGLLTARAGLLDGTTPATYDIEPPVRTVARDWVYSASVQNKGEGDIKLAIVDVTQ